MEIWKDVKNYEGFYQVSDIGSIKSILRIITASNGQKRRFKGRVIKPGLNSGGYYGVTLCKNGKPYYSLVHTLVAIAFKGHKPNGFEAIITHKDGDKLNNKVDNLEIIERVRVSMFKGVVWNSKKLCWQAKGDGFFMGQFMNEGSAHIAYKNYIKTNK